MRGRMLSNSTLRTLDDGIAQLKEKYCGDINCSNCPYSAYRCCMELMIIDKILSPTKEVADMFKHDIYM